LIEEIQPFWLLFFGEVALTQSVIDQQASLEEFLPSLHAATWIAVDTEADSLHSYPEKLCLIQISTSAGDVLIDPLAGLDLAPLIDILRPHELILHGADYDLRLLWRTFGFAPGAVFDTMLAARFLGLQEFGLNNLVQKYMGVELEKGPQKANWSRRPLTEKMIFYAMSDTRYLKPMTDILREELVQKGRLEWHREACARLIVECSQVRTKDPHLAWRIKGNERLSRKGLAVLRELWHWRELEAVQANKPPYFVLSHELMVQIADASCLDELEGLLPPHLSPRRCQGIVQAFKKGQNVEGRALPDRIRNYAPHITMAQNRQFEILRARRDEKAAELGLDPSFLASRAMLLETACDGEAAVNAMMTWQRGLLLS
jgi:ribonuclease D